MKNLLIINAGNFGREVLTWAKQMPEHGTRWKIKGFLDSRAEMLRGSHCTASIVATPEDYMPEEDDLFVCAIGRPLFAKKYCDQIRARGGEFCNVIHPSVVFGDDVRLGMGVIICPYAVLSNNVTIGDFVGINLHVSVGHDVMIGNYSQVYPHACLGGHAVIHDGVTVGSGAVVLPKAVVHEGATIGAGSVVLTHVQDHSTVFGVPAKRIAVPQVQVSVET